MKDNNITISDILDAIEYYENLNDIKDRLINAQREKIEILESQLKILKTMRAINL
jgi:hypothetical protein